jgi:hypothetical protein
LQWPRAAHENSLEAQNFSPSLQNSVGNPYFFMSIGVEQNDGIIVAPTGERPQVTPFACSDDPA